MSNHNNDLISWEAARPRLEALGWEMVVEQNSVKFIPNLPSPVMESYHIPNRSGIICGILSRMVFSEQSIAWLEEEKQAIDSGEIYKRFPSTQEETEAFLVTHPELAPLIK